jgi:hypothetical protein
MSYRLQYIAGTRYAHLSDALWTRTYPDRATAEAERARIVEACGDRGDIEIVDAQNPLEIRGNGSVAWENKASPQGALTPAGSDHRSILETNGG